MFVIRYTIISGRVIEVTYRDWKEVKAATERLDRRIEKGTCLGYIMTKIEGRPQA